MYIIDNMIYVITVNIVMTHLYDTYVNIVNAHTRLYTYSKHSNKFYKYMQI